MPPGFSRRLAPFMLAAGLIGWWAVAAAAQTKDAAIEHNARIRVTTSDGRRVTGHVVGLDERAISIRVNDAAAALMLQRDAVRTLEVSDGRSRTRHVVIGAILAAAAGAVWGYAATDSTAQVSVPSGTGTFVTVRDERAASALSCAIITAPLGALIGFALPPGERWRRVPAEGVRMAVAPGRDARLSLSLAVRF
jgi:translation initiation factor IF-1